MKSILFLCIHNSARSQMAEAYMKKFGKKHFIADSAGLEAGMLNPLAVEVMKEDGIDISENKTKNVNDFFDQGKKYDYVVTVCDQASASRCPVFPGPHKKLNWSFEDPSGFSGAKEMRLQETRKVRDQIRNAVLNLLNEFESRS